MVLYTGSKEDREVIQQHEFFWAGKGSKLKFDILLVEFLLLL